MKIVVATTNEHKLNELKDMAKNYDLELLSLKDINFVDEIIEDGLSYEENSLIKVKAIMNKTDLPVMADDSGLEIDALGEHYPGIHTHRYAIENGGQEKVNDKISRTCASSKAKFTCVITLGNVTEKPLVFKGEFKGQISPYVSKIPGFGYDPIFVPNGYNVPVSELPIETKNAISHRALAFKNLLDYLLKNGIIFEKTLQN